MTLSQNHSAGRRRFLCGCAGLVGLSTLSLAGCSRDTDGHQSQAPLEIDPQTSCSLDGMLLADFPGPKGQIHYAQDRQVDWFCDTVELDVIRNSSRRRRKLRPEAEAERPTTGLDPLQQILSEHDRRGRPPVTGAGRRGRE